MELLVCSLQAARPSRLLIDLLLRALGITRGFPKTIKLILECLDFFGVPPDAWLEALFVRIPQLGFRTLEVVFSELNEILNLFGP